jgi:hypothetical protein
MSSKSGTQECLKGQQNHGFRLITSQSTLIHQTAIGGKKLIKSGFERKRDVTTFQR